jgi:hypothetical protein
MCVSEIPEESIETSFGADSGHSLDSTKYTTKYSATRYSGYSGAQYRSNIVAVRGVAINPAPAASLRCHKLPLWRRLSNTHNNIYAGKGFCALRMIQKSWTGFILNQVECTTKRDGCVIPLCEEFIVKVCRIIIF